MTRLLILLAVAIFLAYLATRGLARLRDKLGELLTEPAMANPQKVNRQKTGNELAPCAFCGVHFPRSRAVRWNPDSGASADATAFYCSEACQRRAMRPVDEVTRTRSA